MGTLIPLLAVLMFAWGGVTFYMAAGDSNKLNVGKSILKATVIGLVLVYSSWLIVTLFLSTIGVDIDQVPWTLEEGRIKWYEINCDIPIE